MSADDSAISPDTLKQISHAIHGWSSAYGEDSPENIRVVSTNRDDAVTLIRPGGSSEMEACFLVFLEGCFRISWTLKQPEATKVWAALMIDPRFMHVGAFTVRPLDQKPIQCMSDLGTVYSIG